MPARFWVIDEIMISNLLIITYFYNVYRFCVNALCKTTGTYVHGVGDPHTEECSSPLEGRYLTIQRILTVAAPLGLSEIDVIFLKP